MLQVPEDPSAAREALGLALVPEDGGIGSALRAGFDHFVALQRHLAATAPAWCGCGSYLMDGSSLAYEPCMLAKQRLLFERAAALPEGARVLEVGVHAGHSALIMMMAHPTLRVTAVDPCFFAHTEACVDELNRRFGGRVRLIKGRSEDALPHPHVTGEAPYHLLHIDGDHRVETMLSDARQALAVAAPGATFVFDDYDPGVPEVLAAMPGAFEGLELPDCRWRNCAVVVAAAPKKQQKLL